LESLSVLQTNIELPNDLEIPLSREMKTWLQGNLYKNVYSSIIYNNQKCPLMIKWINKICYTHTMEYYLAIKINKAFIHGMT
jgi:hypothetical protein